MALNLRLRTITGGQDLEVENGTSIGELQALVAAQERREGQKYNLVSTGGRQMSLGPASSLLR